MCGILAIIYRNYRGCHAELYTDKIFASVAWTKMRGPDKTVSICTPEGLYFFSRLSINDTSSSGDQPFIGRKITATHRDPSNYRKTKSYLLCNGEIYNYKELIKKHDLKVNSKSDCEVILRLYEKFSVDSKGNFNSPFDAFQKTVGELYGVYAIVLSDGDYVFVARDRVGIRPLFFGLDKDGSFLALSSIPQTLTTYCDKIMPFPPGAVAVHTRPDRGLQIKDIFKFLTVTKLAINNVRIYDPVEKIRETLINAVRMRAACCDRKIGCMLSGGLDSSLITAILCKTLGNKNVRTYAIGMQGSVDLYYAKKVAEYLGTNHTEVLFTEQEGFDIIPEVIKITATYDITTIRASVGMYLLAKYIAKNTDDKVIFSGEGADELFQGYLYFHKAPDDNAAERESLRLLQELHLYDVLRVDRCISNCGLEPRVPFLDRQVVDTVLAISAAEKRPKSTELPDGLEPSAFGWPNIRPELEKYILREAFRGWLPDEVLYRRKEGFSDGVSSMQKPWYAYIQERLDTMEEMNDYTGFPSKEACYYAKVFHFLFPNYKVKIPYWMPKWSENVTDPSGRLIRL